MARRGIKLANEKTPQFTLEVFAVKDERLGVQLMQNDERIAFDWIPNVLGLSSDAEAAKTKIQGVKLKQVIVQEGLNGGRTNQKKYGSVAEYLADPVVKANCQKYLVGGLASRISYTGEPHRVDKTYIVGIDNKLEVKLVNIGYDPVIPQAWYDEFFADTIQSLRTNAVYETAAEALDSLPVADDIFGSRYFFVIKGPLRLKKCMKEVAGYFKGQSHPLTTDEFVFIGIRSKPCELGGIKLIYNQGGWVLKDRSWDWS